MHEFLSSVGFSEIKKRDQLEALVNNVIEDPTHRVVLTKDDGTTLCELSRDYGEFMGIAVRGEYDDDNKFKPEYFFPYFCGTGVTTYQHVDIEKHSDKEAFAGVCDETRIGITLIFYMQNPLEFFREYKEGLKRGRMQTTLSGLAKQGMILLPVNKEENEKKKGKTGPDRLSLLEKAKNGDEEAIESLTLEDIDTYSMLSRRIGREDVLTIVNTYFMPYGIESDQYAILGIIEDFHYTRNYMTGEDICIMTLNCNGMSFDVCINIKDMVGEPIIGRRFKGVIWMQGAVFHI
ncbi:MAG: DUF3881 family protein [Lachnospiraceae bacterium]|nr:DUF3881 family protein [Lachnospiraceae bacterium]